MGIPIDYGDFILIRPKYNYRMNASVIIIKNNPPVVIDAGTPADPGITAIKNAFKKHQINPKSVKYIIITHSHQDHCFNLWNLQRLCSNAKTICHRNSSYQIKNLAGVPSSWIKAIDSLGKSKMLKYLYKTLSTPTMILFYQSIHIYTKVDYTLNFTCSAKDFHVENMPKIKVGNLTLRFIHTPGHEPGHLTILDSNKNLFLGDFVPFTPWITPVEGALDKMINSIKLILRLQEKDVERAVRSHGDFRRDPNYKGKRNDNGPWFSEKATWEVAPWNEEKARFKYWLDKIYESLDIIPHLLRKRVMNTYEITQKIIPHYENYSFYMRQFFIPPTVTWILSYCMKLEKQGVIKRIYKNKHLYWSI